MLQGQVGDMRREFQRQKDQREIAKDAEFPQPTAAMLLAAQFMMSGDRPFERLEMHQLRLQRSLQSAQRHLEKLREQTAGEEMEDLPEVEPEENRDLQNKPNEEGKSLGDQEKEKEVAALGCVGEAPTPREERTKEACP